SDGLNAYGGAGAGSAVFARSAVANRERSFGADGDGFAAVGAFGRGGVGDGDGYRRAAGAVTRRALGTGFAGFALLALISLVTFISLVALIAFISLVALLAGIALVTLIAFIT